MKLNNLQTKFLGQNFKYFESIDSTQNYVKKLDKENEAINGMVVFSEVQTAGVGTHSRKWYTGKGKNLAFTFVLYPESPIKEFERFTYMLAETMLEAIQILYNINLQIKIPNDIVYNGKKVGGILTESVQNNRIVKKIFVGIGLNVNQESFPGNLSDIATSLKIEFGSEYDRKLILKKFLELFEEKYLNQIERN